MRYAKRFSPSIAASLATIPLVVEIETINICVAVTAPAGRGALKVADGKNSAAAIKGKRKAWLPSRGAYAEMPVYDRYALAVGAGIKGPAIIEEASTALVVPPKAVATVDRSGNLSVVLNA
jgi:N-methylhydantoinase A/oxoprolinase/acetone carboxylase beta subunit